MEQIIYATNMLANTKHKTEELLTPFWDSKITKFVNVKGLLSHIKAGRRETT